MEENRLEVTKELLQQYALEKGEIWYVHKPIAVQAYQMDEDFIVQTLEGEMRGNKGDYVIIGVKGELYPCFQDVFQESYILKETNT